MKRSEQSNGLDTALYMYKNRHLPFFNLYVAVCASVCWPHSLEVWAMCRHLSGFSCRHPRGSVSQDHQCQRRHMLSYLQLRVSHHMHLDVITRYISDTDLSNLIMVKCDFFISIDMTCFATTVLIQIVMFKCERCLRKTVSKSIS